MAQQTAVEWLIEKFTDSGHLWITDKPRDMIEMSQIIEQAKAMEREQSIAFAKIVADRLSYIIIPLEFIEHTYNETYLTIDSK